MSTWRSWGRGVDPAAFVPLGRIVKTHGLAGEVSVAQTGRLPLDRAVGLEVWFVPPPATTRSSVVESVRSGPKGPLLRLRGIDGPEMADALRGLELRIRAIDVPADLPEDEPDPTGLSVLDVARGEIGVVADVIVTGANNVWVVRGGRFGEVLVPVIDQVVGSIDWDTMTAHVRLLPGLIEGD